MMDPKNAIEVKSLKKKFIIEKLDLDNKKIFNKYPTRKITNNVLNDITFSIKKGEIVGIIGKNGAGKSTLLSIISKIMEPDSGTIEVNGKIASILELGMGFHSDLSGRENIYLKGELYGFSRRNLDEKIEGIIEYSGISEYIDNPVRTYSSGMIGRLAFAIMVNVDSEIMLVDEILSVGDASFKEKARHHFIKMSKSGKTVIFVSHTMSDIETLCSRVIWIDDGTIAMDGPAKKVCSEFINKISESPEFIFDLAKEGIPDSQYKLALLYRDGKYFEKNITEYEHLIELAALSGHTDAEVKYAEILVDRNKINEAIELYQSAAKKGNEIAKMKLASMSGNDNNIRSKLLENYRQMALLNNPIYEYKYAEALIKTAVNAEERKTAFEFFSKSSKSGYGPALQQMAIMYRDGNGVEKNLQKMEELLKKSSELGYLPSIMFLANTYYQGRLLPRNEIEAFRLYLDASKYGNSDAIYRVAMAYRDGEGVEKDLKKSTEYFELYIISILTPYQLGALDYIKINDCECDDLLTEYFTKTSCFLNTPLVYNSILLKIANGESVSNEMKIMNTLSSFGYIDAIRKMGNFYYDGIGVEKCHSQAYNYYLKAANLGDTWCLYKIAEMYRDGDGVALDLEKSKEIFIELSKLGNTGAMDNIIAMCVTKQINDDELYKEIFTMMEKIGNKGNSDALKKMGNYYYNGFGVKKDYVKALMCYEKSAILGDKWCKNRVCEMYRDGRGTSVNKEKAAKWYTD